jgi:hypothetical protein
MEKIIDAFTSVAIEVLVVLIGSIGVSIANKVRGYLDNLKKKDELGIVSIVTDAVVQWAEAELKGKPGIEKRNFAVTKAVEILQSKGINVNQAEIIAGIENGVNRLRLNNLEQKQNPVVQDGLNNTSR